MLDGAPGLLQAVEVLLTALNDSRMSFRIREQIKSHPDSPSTYCFVSDPTVLELLPCG